MLHSIAAKVSGISTVLKGSRGMWGLTGSIITAQTFQVTRAESTKNPESLKESYRGDVGLYFMDDKAVFQTIQDIGPCKKCCKCSPCRKCTFYYCSVLDCGSAARYPTRKNPKESSKILDNPAEE